MVFFFVIINHAKLIQPEVTKYSLLLVNIDVSMSAEEQELKLINGKTDSR